MELDRRLLVNFAKAVNNNKNEQSLSDKYIRGTAKVIDGKKYVQLDGSNVTTPISETVDVQNGDRVLVSIENHSATILGNFTFPPSARKEQEAIDKAEDAQNGSNLAGQKAQEAIDKSTEANEKASSASMQAEIAKTKSEEALTAANEANKNIAETKEKAEQAVTDAQNAKNAAADAQKNVADAQSKIDAINGEITNVKGDISGALEDLHSQSTEIESIKQTYSTKVETDNVKAELKTEIETKVGELKTTVEETYAAKTDVVAMEGKLQTQITQNAEGLSSQASKVERLESDTAQAQQDVNKALENAANAQQAAQNAQNKATAAQEAADNAKMNANEAKEKADKASDAALKAAIDARVADEALTSAKTALDEAKKNYDLIISNPGSTQEQIEEAQAAVDTATANVNKALENAATAAYAADKAQQAADKAIEDATNAKNTADNAQNKADAAQTLADKAQADAAQAQKDVAALTERVTSAETSIKQNAENITLNANKTEEIGNDLKNNYYSKTETDAQIKVESDKISSTVSNKITTEIGKVQVGGRNLALKTNYGTLNWSWSMETGDAILEEVDINGIRACKMTRGSKPIGGWNIITYRNIQPQKYEPNTEYTVSFDIFPSVDSGIAFRFVKSNGVGGFTNMCPTQKFTANKWNKISAVIKTYSELPEATDQRLYMIYMDSTAGVSYIFKNLKIEKGNKATDWTPAPEDMATDEDAKNVLETAQNAQNKADNVDSRLTISESTIKQLSDSISSLVTDENGNSMMTQTSNGWTFNISDIEKNINDATNQLNDLSGTIKEADSTINNLNNLVNDISKKTAYIVMTTDEQGNPCIELGKEGNDFKVRITNTSVDFMEGTSKITYISNETLYIERAIVKDELQIGETTGFIWKRRGNGNMGLRWVGGA